MNMDYRFTLSPHSLLLRHLGSSLDLGLATSTQARIKWERRSHQPCCDRCHRIHKSSSMGLLQHTRTLLRSPRWYEPRHLGGDVHLSTAECVAIALFLLVNVPVMMVSIWTVMLSSTYQTAYDAALTLGTLGAIDFVLLWIPTNRNSVLTFITGMSFERSVRYHRWIARYTLLVLLLHGLGVHWSLYLEGEWPAAVWSWGLDANGTNANGSGLVALLVGLLIGIMAMPWLRRGFHELFLRLHWVLFILFLLFGFLHSSTFLGLAMFTVVPWLVDWYLRVKMWRRPVEVLGVHALSAGVVRIDFQCIPPLIHEPGQWVLLCIPSISPWEWHPFSLSSSPHHRCHVVHIRAIGDWTKRLYVRALRNQLGDLMRMYIEGPYGTLALPQPLRKYKRIVLFSGGIGVTPMQSIFNAIVHEEMLLSSASSSPSCPSGASELQLLEFIWSVREPAMLRSMYAPNTVGNSALSLEQVFQPLMLALLHSESTRSQDHNSEALEHKVSTSLYFTLSRENVNLKRWKALKRRYSSLVHLGRPDVEKLLSRHIACSASRLSADSVERTAVLVCGPESMVNEVTSQCHRLSTKMHKFDVHSEVFAF